MASEPASPHLQSSGKPLHQSNSSPHASTLPPVFVTSSTISQGIRTLENFGFRTKLTEFDPTKMQLYRSRCYLNMGFHVTDLWSQRQQLEFLKTMKLQKAQFARERQAHFVNFLIESGKRLGKVQSLEDLQGDIDREVQEVDKYRLSGKRLTRVMKLAGNLSPRAGVTPEKKRDDSEDRSLQRFVSPPQKPRRVQRLEGLIGHCSTTLKGFKRADNQLPESKRSSPKSERIPEDVVLDSAISLRVSGKRRFANPLRHTRR